MKVQLNRLMIKELFELTVLKMEEEYIQTFLAKLL